MDTTTTSMHIHGAVLTRRQFVKTGGTLIVGVSLGGFEMLTAAIQGAQQAVGRNSLDPSRVSSWFEVHADNTLTLRTGKSDFGQSTVTTAYKQIVAEELNLQYESITSVIMGDTDRTPDGGVSAGYLHIGGLNLRKAAAYTQQALLDVAATTLGVDRSQLTAAEGRISGGGKSITYGELVAGQELALSIPVTGDPGTLYGVTVTGDPPMKPTSQYTVIGKSYPNFVTASKVAAKETLGHRRASSEHAACARDPPEDTRLEADRRGKGRHAAISKRTSDRERRSGGCCGSNRVGSD